MDPETPVRGAALRARRRVNSSAIEGGSPFAQTPAYIRAWRAPVAETYIAGVPEYGRAEITRHQLHSQHRWRLKDYVAAMASEEKSPYAPTRAEQMSELAEAVFKDPYVVRAMAKHIDMNWPGVRLFFEIINSEAVRELEELRNLPAMGEFVAEREPSRMNLREIDNDVLRATPTLFAIISPLTRVVRDMTAPGETISYLSVVSIIARQRHRILNANFGTLLGIYLYSLGVKRRALSVLCGLGITASYRSIIRATHAVISYLALTLPVFAQQYRKQLLLCWDNFDYHEGVHHVTLGNRGQHVCSTTGLAIVGMFIPSEGIPISELDMSKGMSRKTLMMAPGNFQDDVEQELQLYRVFEALRYVHGQALDERIPPWWRPKFPSLERLGSLRTNMRELGPMLINEGTITGTYSAIREILLQKLKLREDDPVFGESLQLTYGDQKTVSLVQTAKRDSMQSRHTFGAMRFLLPVPGLLHFRMNFIDLQDSTFRRSGKATSDAASLHENCQYMGISRGDTTAFHQKEEAILRCYSARVVSMLYERISRQCDVSDASAVNRFLREASADTLLHIISKVRDDIWNARHHGHEQDDEVLTTNAQFLDAVSLYLNIKESIRWADLGILKRYFARSAVLLAGSRKVKYASIAMYMTWLTHSEATSERLKKVILANGLVNMRGASNSWFEIDRLNEFLNLRLKTAMRFRRTSTESLERLFVRVSVLSEYAAQAKVALEGLAGEKTNTTHRMKQAQLDVTRLAYHLYNVGVVRDEGKRESVLKPPSFVARGNDNIVSNIARFQEIYCVANGVDSCDTDAGLDAGLDAGDDNAVLDARDVVDDADLEGMLPLLDDDLGLEIIDVDETPLD